jgi:predicted  nucleic acid-binding Zn-ribbon protein
MIVTRRHRINLFLVFAVLAFVVVIIVAPGCGKKTVSPYGPGADWIDDMRDRITKNIADENKSIKLLEQVNRIEAVLMDLDHTLLEYYEKLEALDANYHSTRDDFQEKIDSFNDYRHKKVDELIAIAEEMKQIAGRADWNIFSDIDATLYESWQRSYGF